LMATLPLEVNNDFWERRRRAYGELWRFLSTEGVLGVLTTDDRGEGALVFAESTGVWEASQPLPPPAVVLAPEGYDRLAHLTEKGVPARVRLDAAVATADRDEDGLNVV